LGAATVTERNPADYFTDPYALGPHSGSRVGTELLVDE